MKNYLIALLILSSFFYGCLDENPKSEEIQTLETELPLREVKPLEFYINQIKTDTAWMKTIAEKALKAGVSEDEMIKIDAEYIEFQEAEIINIENGIITNKEWLEMVKQKAKDQNVSLDEMIRADAYYTYQKNNGQID